MYEQQAVCRENMRPAGVELAPPKHSLSLMECTLASLSLTVLNAKGKALMARPAIVPKKTTRGFALLKSLDLGIIELMMTN